jgi:hypothetical protein
MNNEKNSQQESLYHTLKRWIHTPLQRKYEWQSSSRYWSLLHRWKYIEFWFKKRIFELSKRLDSTNESFSIFRTILKSISLQIFLAIFLVAMLEIIERLLSIHSGVIEQFLPNMVYHRLALIFNQIQIDSGTFTSILGILAQIAGIFLGLYFTAISIVISTIYPDAPSDVRSLLLQEKIGNTYLKNIALLGGVAIFLLALNTLGFRPGILNLFLIIFLGLIAIFSFVIIGTRTFNFFDPAALVRLLIPNLHRLIHSAGPSEFQWQDPPFQSHYQEQAENRLNTYLNILSLAIKKEAPRKTLSELAYHALYLLRSYAEEKSHIPSNSYWFKRTYKYQGWLTAGYPSVNIAISTGTTLQPKTVPDMMWFEARIEEIITKIMQTFFENGEIRNAYELFNEMQNTMNFLAENFAIEESIHLFKVSELIVCTQIHEMKLDIDDLEDNDEQSRLKIGLVDLYGLGLMNILVDFSKRLQKTTDSFASGISKIKWNQPKTIYTTILPRKVVEQLEHIQECLEFELEVEGHIISPLWYQQQTGALAFVNFLSRIVDDLIKELESVFADEVEALISNKQYVFAVQLIQRGLEACEKFRVHLREIKKCFNQLVDLQRVENITWPIIEWDNLDKRINDVNEKLFIAFAQTIPISAKFPQPGKWPDYFGQAYCVLSDRCSQAMFRDNELLFQKIFPPFFNSCSLAYDRTLDQLRGYDETIRFDFSTESIEDMLEISGYAIIYSELEGRKYWEIARKEWDDWFARHPDPKVLLKFIYSVIELRESRLAFFPRDDYRVNWKQSLEQRLRKEKLLDGISCRYPVPDDDSLPQHPSAIIRALIDGRHLAHDPKYVFIVVYLSKRPEAGNFELTELAKSFAESLRYEQSRGNPKEGKKS